MKKKIFLPLMKIMNQKNRSRIRDAILIISQFNNNIVITCVNWNWILCKGREINKEERNKKKKEERKKLQRV